MEFSGEIISIAGGLDTWQVTFSINEKSALKQLEELKKVRLRVTAKKWKQKRSLDANAYVWQLMSKIADVIDSSKEEVYEIMLQKYGYLYQDEDGYITVTVKDHVDMGKIEGHWMRYKGNGQFTSYLMIKGSSQYDTKEMSHFIDMIVEEAKGLGIETLPPGELERMKAAWVKE